MEAKSTYETSVNYYQTTLPFNPEDSHLHSCRRENLKSYKGYCDMAFITAEIQLLAHMQTW
jgi:hypothetical protein